MIVTNQSILRDALTHLSRARTALKEGKQFSLQASVDELISDVMDEIKIEDRATMAYFISRHDSRAE